MKLLLTCLMSVLSYLSMAQSSNREEAFLKKDSIVSSLDAYTQVFYYHKAEAVQDRPLVIQLHSWSYPADSLKTIGLSTLAKNKDYNYVFPNFRGVNNHPKACCSDYVISDIDEAIDWALKNMNVDKSKIYMVGYSGGGYATLAMYMKSRHKIKAFSAWASIADLSAWYAESLERKNKYVQEITACIDAMGGFEDLKAKERSPLYWKTPTKRRKNSSLHIFAGIKDGHLGNVVPITQSISFYNKILHDYKEKEEAKYVSKAEEKTMLETQTYPNNKIEKLLDRTIYYQKTSKNTMLTIFEGGHEMLSSAAIEYIERAVGNK